MDRMRTKYGAVIELKPLHMVETKDSPSSGSSVRNGMEKVSEMAQHNFFGFDLNPDLVKATKMNMVMNNDGSGNILQTNSLLPLHEWSDEFKTRLADALDIKKSEIRNHTTIGFFNVIVTLYVPQAPAHHGLY